MKETAAPDGYEYSEDIKSKLEQNGNDVAVKVFDAKTNKYVDASKVVMTDNEKATTEATTGATTEATTEVTTETTTGATTEDYTGGKTSTKGSIRKILSDGWI